MLIHLLVVVIVLAIIYYLITTLIPLPAPFRTIVNIIFCVILILVLLQLFGLAPGYSRGIF
jgi:uncharacterized membrane protein (DUF373 family)